MAYTPGLGRTPAIMATRLGSATLAAVAAFSLAQWWPFGSTPGQGVVISLFALGFLAVLAGLAVPVLTEGRPTRVTPVDGGVAIPARRLSLVQALVVTMLLFAAGAVIASAGGLGGPRDSPSEVWAVIAGLCAFGLPYVLVQRPWRRRIELRPDELVLGTGEEASHIPWDDIAAIEQAPLNSGARSGMKHMRTYNAAALTVHRHSDLDRPRARRLEDRYPTGDLACRFTLLLPALQHLVANPADRRLLTDADQALRLLTESPVHAARNE